MEWMKATISLYIAMLYMGFIINSEVSNSCYIFVGLSRAINICIFIQYYNDQRNTFIELLPLIYIIYICEKKLSENIFKKKRVLSIYRNSQFTP